MPAKGSRATGGAATKPASGGAPAPQANQAKGGADASKPSFPTRAQAGAAKNAGGAKAPKGKAA